MFRLKKRTVNTVRPFVEPLPIPQRVAPTQGILSQPLEQRMYSFGQPNLVVLEEKEALHQFHPDIPPTLMWTYNGTFPGPTIVHRLGQSTCIRRINSLDPNYSGFGIIKTVLHHHGGWQAPIDDGWPLDYILPGQSRDYLIPNILPVADDRSYWGSTLWYHDHVADHTAGNVYHGLAGMVQQFDAFDSDNENDPSPSALRLPSGQYDVPLAFSDYILNTDGSLFFDQLEDKGQAGNLFVVNGKIQPYFNVAARKYRFRLLIASQGRHYEFYLSNNAPFQVIASDGGLLESPVTMRRLYMVPGERYEIIVDFSGYPLGTQIALMNDLFHADGNKPEEIRVPQPQLLFVVDRNAPDPSQVPQRLSVIEPPDVSNVVATRRIEFDRRNGGWQINRRFWDPTRPLFTAKANTTERWSLVAGGGGWHHPFHVHIDSVRILSRNRRPAAVPLHERGRKDVVNVPGGQQAEVLMKIHSYTGRYMLHCHNPAHEDLYMMGFVDVRP